MIALLVLPVLFPFFFAFNKYAGIFILAFFSHLVLDLLYDKLSIGSFAHWKFRRRI